MTNLSPCAFCHRETPLERHHVAGAANAPRLTIHACEHCHRALTERQRDAGIRLSHREPGDEHDRAWALVHGLSELVVAPASDDEASARTIERVSLLAGRAIASLADHPLGPDPIAASAREGTREHHHPGPREATIESHAASFAARFETTDRAWRDELQRPLGLSLDENAIVALLRRLDDDDTDGAAMILRDLSRILERIESAATAPLSASDLDGLEHGARTILDFLARVATVESDAEAAAILGAVS